MLSQPVMTAEDARERKRLFDELWHLTEAEEEREVKFEEAKALFESVTGIPFVRKG